MAGKINISLLSSLSLELRELSGPLYELPYRLRDLLCETILVTKKKKKSYISKIKPEVKQSLLPHLI